MGPPDARFLWPLDVAESGGGDHFGYIMPLRESRFLGLVEHFKSTAPWSARALARLGLQLADSYLQLHSRGLCYRDISWGNVFFDPSTGEVLICDNDNVGINGKMPLSIHGTARFMAPEIVCHQIEPSTTSDLYSLAVLLFYVFM